MASSKEELQNQYQLKKQRQHILDAPDTYIGGIEADNITDWTMDGNKMVKRQFQFIPGLYKCFDEGIVNCRDHMIRMQGKIDKGLKDAIPVTLIDISVNKETGVITMLNDGDGIDIAEHPVHKIMIPEMIFGHLMTSTNYNNDDFSTTSEYNGGSGGPIKKLTFFLYYYHNYNSTIRII